MKTKIVSRFVRSGDSLGFDKQGNIRFDDGLVDGGEEIAVSSKCINSLEKLIPKIKALIAANKEVQRLESEIHKFPFIDNGGEYDGQVVLETDDGSLEVGCKRLELKEVEAMLALRRRAMGRKLRIGA